MHKSFIHRARMVLLVLLLELIAFSYHPSFLNDGGSLFTLPILLITVILTVASFDLNLFKSNFIILYGATFVLMVNIVIVYYGIGWNIEFSVLREVLIPLCILIIGYNTTITDDDLLKILIIYALSLLFTSFFQIQHNIGGFVIAEQYLAEAKNALGPMLGVICALFILLSMNSKNKYFLVLYLFLAFLCFLFIVTIRARLAIISTSLALLFIFYLYYRGHNDKNRLIIILLIISAILFFIYSLRGSLLPDSMVDYIYNSFTLNTKNDFFSDRDTRNMDAINIIIESPFWGNLTMNRTVKLVHNYPLLKMSEYGIIGSIPWIFLYMSILIKSILISLREGVFQIRNFGFILIIIPFLVSMGEPTFPFGPGTANFLVYFMFGVSLRYKENPHI